MRLLIVEDDADLAQAMAAALDRRHYSSDLAHNAADALQLLESAQYAAVLVDLGLPDGDGMTIIRKLRAAGNPLPILVVTARGTVENRVAGLDSGADDYIVKPVDPMELVARIDAVMRRRGNYSGTRLSLANMELDTLSGDLFVDGQHVLLSGRERQLAELLLRRAGHVVTKKLAEDQLFGLDDPVGSNAVEVYAHRLRRRLAAAGARVGIETIRGVGYLLREHAG